MVRVIKFRGKRLDNGEWLFGDLLQVPGSKLRTFIFHDIEGNIAVDPATVGQLAGEFDGKEIYEGDIVKDSDTYVVKFGEYSIGCCGCCYSSHRAVGFYLQKVPVNNIKGEFMGVPYTDDHVYADENTWDNLEVVGNIYENAEGEGETE